MVPLSSASISELRYWACVRQCWARGEWAILGKLCQPEEFGSRLLHGTLLQIQALAHLMVGDHGSAKNKLASSLEVGGSNYIAARILLSGVHYEATSNMYLAAEPQRRHAYQQSSMATIREIVSGLAAHSGCQAPGYVCALLGFPFIQPSEFVSYSQNCEDVMLARALAHIKDGNYLDIGAQHPIVDSVSLAFYERGWRGIHVEPVSEYAQLLRFCRPGEEVIQACAGSAEGTRPFYLLGGLSTAVTVIAKSHASRGARIVETTTQFVPLSTILEKFGGKEIHWMKIDVEGSERDVLESWGELQTRPWVVVVESTLPLSTEENDKEWVYLLTFRGYREVHFDGLNRYYLHESQQQLTERFRCGPNVFDRFVLPGTASNSNCSYLNDVIRSLEAMNQGRVEALST